MFNDEFVGAQQVNTSWAELAADSTWSEALSDELSI